MPVALEQTRVEWERGYRRFQDDVRESARGEAVLGELEAVTAELRRRVGQTFTLAELADAYRSSEAWTREAVAEIEPAAGWPRRLATVTDAAFHVYSRGAIDYERRITMFAAKKDIGVGVCFWRRDFCRFSLHGDLSEQPLYQARGQNPEIGNQN